MRAKNKVKTYLISTRRLFYELPLFQIRELNEDETGKSLDYWEGYTKAVARLVHYLKKYEKRKENN